MRVDQKKRLRWDTFVIILAIWSVLYVPFGISFRITDAQGVQYVNYFVDSIFVLDIIINFRTTYFDKEGDQIYEWRSIAKRYVKSGKLIIDLLATVPVQYFVSGQVTFVQLLQLLKIIRVRRLPFIISRSNLREESKNVFKVLQLIFILVLIYHLSSCLWVVVISQSQVWIPPVDFIDYTKSDYFNESIIKQYLLAVYYSILLLNGGEIGPRTTGELIVASLVMIAGSIINANLFGTMVMYIQNIRRKETKIQEKFDTVNTSMKNLRLPPSLQRKVKEYIMSTESTLLQQQELNKFLRDISPSLRFEVNLFIYSHMVRHNPIISQAINESSKLQKDITDFMVTRFETVLFGPEDVIIEHGEKSNDLYFIARGQCGVYIRHQKREYSMKTLLRHGDQFGQIGAIFNCRRTMRVVSQKYSTLAKMDQTHYKEMAFNYPNVEEKFKEAVYQYNDRNKRRLQKIISKIPYFKRLSLFHLHQVLFQFKIETVEPNHMLIQNGAEIKGLYVLLEGRMFGIIRSVLIDIPIHEIEKGSIINYDGVVVPRKSEIYIRAHTQCLVAFLPLSDFNGNNDLTLELNNQIVALKDAVNDELKEMEDSELRPYPIDIYKIDVKPKHSSLFENRFLLARRPDGDRNAKFKVKSAFIRFIQQLRNFRKGLPLKDLVMAQMEKEKLEDDMNRATLDMRKQITRRITSLFPNEKGQPSERLPSGQSIYFKVSSKLTSKSKFSNFVSEHTKLSTAIERTLKILATHSATLNKMEKEVQNTLGSLKLEWEQIEEQNSGPTAPGSSASSLSLRSTEDKGVKEPENQEKVEAQPLINFEEDEHKEDSDDDMFPINFDTENTEFDEVERSEVFRQLQKIGIEENIWEPRVGASDLDGQGDTLSLPKKESQKDFLKKLRPQQTIRSLFHARKGKKPNRSNFNLDEALLDGQDDSVKSKRNQGQRKKSEEDSPDRSLSMSDEYSPQESPHINIKLLPPGA